MQVSNGREELLAQGPLVLHINREDQPPLITAQVRPSAPLLHPGERHWLPSVTPNLNAGAAAQVQQCRWQLLQSMPTLKASEQAYMFAMGDNIFYSVLVAPGAAPGRCTPLDSSHRCSAHLMSAPHADTTHGDQQMLEILLAECTALQAGSPPSETEQSELASEVRPALLRAAGHACLARPCGTRCCCT